jgi:O-acetylhomoserine (thiol)-lyase
MADDKFLGEGQVLLDGRVVCLGFGDHRFKVGNACGDHSVQLVEPALVETRHRKDERIGADDDLTERVELFDSKRGSAGVGDRVDLALGIRTLALSTHFFDQAVGGHPLQRSVESANADVRPLMDMLLLGQQPKLMAVHGTLFDKRVEDVKTNAGHVTTLAEVVWRVNPTITPCFRRVLPFKVASLGSILEWARVRPPQDSASSITKFQESIMADWQFETKQIHSGAQPDPTTNARATPIYKTTSYVFNSTEHAQNLFALAEFGNIYSRIMNPTNDVVEQRIAALEGGTAALAVASGSSAITYAVLNIAGSGDHIVSSSSIYGGTYNLFKYTLAKLGIEVTFVEDQDDAAEWAAAVRPNTKLFFAETIGNPKINILDIEKVAEVAHDNDLPLIVDNTIATPYLIRPFEFGADIVVHSATKFLGGHGTVIAGLIVDGGKFPWTKLAAKFPGLTEPDPSYHGASYTTVLGDAIAYVIKARVQLLRDTGAALSPDSAFALIQGIETLSLRIERHVQNTQEIAEWLENHPDVASVNYSGLPSSPWYAAANKYAPKGVGAVVSFELKGGVAAGKALVEGVTLFSHLANIGDVRSLIIHPASTTHSQLTPEQQLTTGVTPGLVRLSVGLENVADLKADLEAGLALARNASASTTASN